MEEKDAKQFDKNLLQCPFCPCIFFTAHDLDCHMDAYSHTKEEHLENFRRERHRTNRR